MKGNRMSLLAQFAGSKVPAAFDNSSTPGTTVAGTVTAVEVKQAMSYVPPGSNEEPQPLVFKDGKPKLQLVVTVQTDLRDASIEDDEGLRRFHIKMWFKSDRESLIAAVTGAGDDDVHVGAWFSGTYGGYGVESNGAPAAWKVHTYGYRKPSALAATTPPASNPVSAGSPAAVTPSAPVADPAAAVAALKAKLAPLVAAGLTHAQIAAVPGIVGLDGGPLTADTVAAILAA